MAPKPFKPPRPRTSTGSTSNSKARGRPKNPSSVSKPKPKVAKSKSAKDKRVSDRFDELMPALSPETRRELEGSEADGDGDDIIVDEDSDDMAVPRNRIPSSQQDIDGQDGEEDEDDDPFASEPTPYTKSKSKSKSRPSNISNLDDEEDAPKEVIPTKLINVILNQFFQNDSTKIKGDAQKAVARYMEVFVREGIARAIWGEDRGGNEGEGRGVLEVEDLEKLAPQLILDF